jgi:hypothetical protein
LEISYFGQLSERKYLLFLADGQQISARPAIGGRHARIIHSFINVQMIILFVDFDEIQKAMEDVVRDTFDYFFDLETGEVIPLSQEIVSELSTRLSDEDSDEIADDIEYIEFDEEPDIPDWMTDEMEIILDVLLDESERYVRIPERARETAYRSMIDFTETIQDPLLKEELRSALDGKGAFRKFKDVLVNFPRGRKRWHRYNARAIRKESIEWLKAMGIEAAPFKKTGSAQEHPQYSPEMTDYPD